MIDTCVLNRLAQNAGFQTNRLLIIVFKMRTKTNGHYLVTQKEQFDKEGIAVMPVFTHLLFAVLGLQTVGCDLHTYDANTLMVALRRLKMNVGAVWLRYRHWTANDGGSFVPPKTCVSMRWQVNGCIAARNF